MLIAPRKNAKNVNPNCFQLLSILKIITILKMNHNNENEWMKFVQYWK